MTAKQLFSFISCTCMCMVGCSAKDAPETVFAPTTQNVKPLGRTYYKDDVLWLFHSNSGAEFRVNAKTLSITVQGDDEAVRATKENAARICIFVNGERVADELLTKSETTLTVFNESSPKDYIVRIVKVSESANSCAAIKSIAVNNGGTIMPTPQKPLKIEFIGDSITCGYGVDDLNPNHSFATATEDSTKSYAYKTGANLDADYSMVSISGWGTISGYTADANVKLAENILPKVYDKIGFTYANTFAGTQPQSLDWDFSRFVPDFVVINLGTNDESYCGKNATKQEEFCAAYAEFLKTVRSKNTNATIVCTLGIMGDTLFPAIEKAVSRYQEETGDAKVYTLRFAAQKMTDGIAADWHPSEKTYEKAAKLLTAKIQSLQN